MHTLLETTPTGRDINRRRHLLATTHAQMMSLRVSPDPQSVEDCLFLALTMQLQSALLRRDLNQEMMQALLANPGPTPPAPDFSSLEQRIADTCGIDA